jgi:rhamnulokinase
MPERIADACRESGQPVPESPAEITRCILDSLALAHRRAITQAQELADHPVDVVHIVGGGTRNALLCQLTADACGLPVVAGPAEAAALGNVLVQARAHGLVGDRTSMRELLARTQSLTRYEPRTSTAVAWAGGPAAPGARGCIAAPPVTRSQRTRLAARCTGGNLPAKPAPRTCTHPMIDPKEPRCVSLCS